MFIQLDLGSKPDAKKKPPLTEATRASEGKPIRVGSWWKALPIKNLTTFKDITAIVGWTACKGGADFILHPRLSKKP
jgi:hypothetical protein